YGHGVDFQCGLADADGDALALLATDADTGVQFQVVADHRYPIQYFRAAADEGGAFHRTGDPAVFDQIRFAGGKRELAAGDVHLATADVRRVQAALDRTDDLLRVARAGQH